MRNASIPAWLMFEPGQDLLELMVESMALLPAADRWATTLATYYCAVGQVQINWRGVVAGSAAANDSRRFPGATVIDLTKPRGAAKDHPLVTAARTGRSVAEAAESAGAATVAKTPEAIDEPEHEKPVAAKVGDRGHSHAPPAAVTLDDLEVVKERLPMTARKPSRLWPLYVGLAGVAAIVTLAIVLAFIAHQATKLPALAGDESTGTNIPATSEQDDDTTDALAGVSQDETVASVAASEPATATIAAIEREEDSTTEDNREPATEDLPPAAVDPPPADPPPADPPPPVKEKPVKLKKIACTQSLLASARDVVAAPGNEDELVFDLGTTEPQGVIDFPGKLELFYTLEQSDDFNWAITVPSLSGGSIKIVEFSVQQRADSYFLHFQRIAGNERYVPWIEYLVLNIQSGESVLACRVTPREMKPYTVKMVIGDKRLRQLSDVDIPLPWAPDVLKTMEWSLKDGSQRRPVDKTLDIDSIKFTKMSGKMSGKDFITMDVAKLSKEVEDEINEWRSVPLPETQLAGKSAEEKEAAKESRWRWWNWTKAAKKPFDTRIRKLNKQKAEKEQEKAELIQEKRDLDAINGELARLKSDLRTEKADLEKLQTNLPAAIKASAGNLPKIVEDAVEKMKHNRIVIFDAWGTPVMEFAFETEVTYLDFIPASETGE